MDIEAFRARERIRAACDRLRKGMTPREPWPDRFWANVDASGDCWEWTGVLNANGYGCVSSRLAHRTAYGLLVGPIPEGKEIDHLCRNRACVNPDHLEPVTHRENLTRGVSPAARNARKIVCQRGHPLTRIYAGRRCLTCAADWRARQRTVYAPTIRTTLGVGP